MWPRVLEEVPLNTTLLEKGGGGFELTKKGKEKIGGYLVDTLLRPGRLGW